MLERGLGVIAQLVEHLICIQKVSGSIPLNSTITIPLVGKFFVNIVMFF